MPLYDFDMPNTDNLLQLAQIDLYNCKKSIVRHNEYIDHLQNFRSSEKMHES